MAKKVEELLTKEEIQKIIEEENKVEIELEEISKEFKNEDDRNEEFEVDEKLEKLILGN